VIGKDRAHKSDRIGGCLFANGCGIGCSARKNMFRRNMGKGFCRVLELHRMRLLGPEIDRDLSCDQFPTSNLSKSPASMGAEGTG